MGNGMTEEDLKASFYTHPAYSTFKEKYPESIESFEVWNRGEGNLNLVMYNYTNFNQIQLHMDYNSHRENTQVNVTCEVPIPGNDRQMHRGAQGDGAVEFIEKMDCLNISLLSDITPTDYDFPLNNYPGIFTGPVILNWHAITNFAKIGWQTGMITVTK